MAAMRGLAPELLVTAKTQRWAPEEFLRTLIEAELAARDASNARTRLKTAVFPVIKTLDEFDRTAQSNRVCAICLRPTSLSSAGPCGARRSRASPLARSGNSTGECPGPSSATSARRT